MNSASTTLSRVFIVSGILSLAMVALFSLQFVFPASAAELESLRKSMLKLSPGDNPITAPQPWQSTVSRLSLIAFLCLAPTTIFGTLLANAGRANLSPLMRRISSATWWGNILAAGLLLAYLSLYLVAFVKTLT